MEDITTLKELQELTSWYNDWVPVSEIQHESPVLATLDTHCLCGAEYAVSVITETAPAPIGSSSESITTKKYTRVACVNPYCWVKQAYSLYHFISSLGFNGIGEKTCLTLMRELYNEFEYNSFLSVFLLDESDIFAVIGDHLTSVFMGIKDAIRETRWKMTDIIPALGIPRLGHRSRLFDIIVDPVQLLSVIMEENGLDDLMRRMGSNDQEFKAQFQLRQIDILLLYTRIAPNFLQKAKRTLYVAITGAVCVDDTNYSRSEFKDLCTSFVDSDGRQYYDIIETKAKSKLEYVIADFPSGSEKYTIGKELGILITAQDFIDLLRRSMPKEEQSPNEVSKLNLGEGIANE